MEQFLSITSIVISALTLIGLLLGFGDKIFRSGGKEQSLSNRIDNLEKSDCEIKDSVKGINSDIKKIKENHLSHIQADMNTIKNDITEIKTTLKFINNK